MVIVLAILAGIAMWINRANENETTPDSGRLVYAPAKVTAVLSDNAQEDFENAEGPARGRSGAGDTDPVRRSQRRDHDSDELHECIV